MPTDPQQMFLNMLEAATQLTDLLNSIKTNLESKGWSAAASEQGAIALVQVIIAKS